MDAQTHGELHPTLAPQAGVKLAQGLHHAQPGAYRPLGIIFMGAGIAEVDRAGDRRDTGRYIPQSGR